MAKCFRPSPWSPSPPSASACFGDVCRSTRRWRRAWRRSSERSASTTGVCTGVSLRMRGRGAVLNECTVGCSPRRCDKCKTASSAVSRTQLRSLPPFLVINLKRFVFYPEQRKLDTRVVFPLHSLDMSPYIVKVRYADALAAT